MIGKEIRQFIEDNDLDDFEVIIRVGGIETNDPPANYGPTGFEDGTPEIADIGHSDKVLLLSVDMPELVRTESLLNVKKELSEMKSESLA